MIVDISLSNYSLATQKLRLDFRAVSGFLWPGGGMENADELIGRLCTIAGMVMEDTIDAALIGGATGSLSERLAVISQAGEDVRAIASVAAIVARRGRAPTNDQRIESANQRSLSARRREHLADDQ